MVTTGGPPDPPAADPVGEQPGDPVATDLTAERVAAVDPEEAVGRLLRDLRSRPSGLTDREAARRREVVGRNELVRARGVGWPRQVLEQLIHPLALLLWVAAALALVTSAPALSIAIVGVIVLNAGFAVVQERQAEQAVEALAAYLPPQTRVLRDGVRREIDVAELVPGDVIAVGEGDRVSADARILSGSVELDISALTGEAQPVLRTARSRHPHGPLLEADDLLFSGTTCTGGEAVAVVFATGMGTELGRIAALSQRVRSERSPLEKQVRRVARLIALVAVGMGLAFIPLGTLIAHLSLADTASFAIGLLVANVPEGLLPTITLALAVGVRLLARQGALVKRISAVETLGSAGVICTDKTGTLTMNRMQVVRAWASGHEVDPTASSPQPGSQPGPDPATSRLAAAAAACTNATWDPADPGRASGDPTELALLRWAHDVGAAAAPGHPERLRQFHFDPGLRRMTTIDREGSTCTAYVKGAPEEVLRRCTTLATGRGPSAPLTDEQRTATHDLVEQWASAGLRVLAVADRGLDLVDAGRLDRDDVERGLNLLGLVAMEDPPRPEVADAVRQCLDAGIRLIVVTGDHGLTAKGIALQVGLATPQTTVITGPQLDDMSEAELEQLLDAHHELIFARSSPEAKLRIADALQGQGRVVAMTGDGVNDAPALKRADIGVAMGRSGTDVAREAATMVLTDDNFATIVSAIRAGRQVYDNVRKFIVYIFAHSTPEVVPFLLYALSGGRVPLPLTVMQILAIDLGTETLPALALGREPAEPEIMERPPRRRTDNVIDREMLLRSWLLLGGVSAVLVTAAFLVTLVHGGWHPGADVSSGPMHTLWRQATTMTFLGIVSCQIGTALAARTQHSSLRRIGLTSNRLLLWGMAFEIAFAAALVLVPPLGEVFGTTRPEGWQLAMLVPMPVLVWGVDEAWRARRRAARAVSPPTGGARSR